MIRVGVCSVNGLRIEGKTRAEHIKNAEDRAAKLKSLHGKEIILNFRFDYADMDWRLFWCVHSTGKEQIPKIESYFAGGGYRFKLHYLLDSRIGLESVTEPGYFLSFTDEKVKGVDGKFWAVKLRKYDGPIEPFQRYNYWVWHVCGGADLRDARLRSSNAGPRRWLEIVGNKAFTRPGEYYFPNPIPGANNTFSIDDPKRAVEHPPWEHFVFGNHPVSKM
jgi:hypothetical protein